MSRFSYPTRALVYGLFVALPLGCAFWFLTPRAVQPGDLWDFDMRVARDMQEYAQHENYVGYVMIALTTIGGIPVMIALAVLGTAWRAWQGKWILVAGWALIPAIGALLNVGFKASFNRERPPQDLRDPFVTETNKSYPSGHAMGATIGWGLAAYMLCLETPSRRRRLLISGGIALLVLGIGLSRVYLRAHWLSDVVGGWMIGLCWLGLSVGVVEMLRRRQEGEGYCSVESGCPI